MTWTLSDTANLALACLHQHRLLSTRQLNQLLHHDRSLRATQRLLADLTGQELISSVRERGGRRGTERVWHLTPLMWQRSSF
jgi:Replication-relaxation